MAIAYQINYPLIWHNEDPATPALIVPLLDDKGLGEEGTENGPEGTGGHIYLLRQRAAGVGI